MSCGAVIYSKWKCTCTTYFVKLRGKGKCGRGQSAVVNPRGDAACGG